MSLSEIPRQYRATLDACQERLGYHFQDPSLLYAALSHASGTDHRLDSNERLEFLGDAILGFLVCELLFHRFPELLEGDMTQIKSAVVSRATCARIGARMGLPEFVLTGRGMDLTRGMPRSLIANAFESIIAAIYLDGGMAEVRRFLVEVLVDEIREIVAGKAQKNFKSDFQQRVQRDFGLPPAYDVLEEAGPDHHKSFKVCARIRAKRFSPAWGTNKKQAEQRAAANALAELDGNLPPWPPDPEPAN